MQSDCLYWIGKGIHCKLGRLCNGKCKGYIKVVKNVLGEPKSEE